jgi:UDP-N-acetylmuramoyl-tripeptide--D-alanyl-D-alanine ligase
VIPLSVGQVAEITGARLGPGTPAGAIITGPVVIDSRQAGPGSLFAALPGARADGHDFAAAAVASGAVAVLGSRPAGVPALIVTDVAAALGRLAAAVLRALPSVTVAGITGSAGKTTTKDLAAQLLPALGPAIWPPASYNNEIGHPLTVLRADERTRYLITELSARGPGHIAQLCRIAPPQIGVVLCVGNAHAGEFGGIEQIARAKAELPAALPAAGVALLNADDPLVLAMADRTAARVVTFGRSPAAGIRAARVTLDERARPRFELQTAAGAIPVRLRLHGEHNVSNALAAAGLALQLGMDLAGVAERLSAAVPLSSWRMQVTDRPDGVTVINDAYNASPEAMAAALAALARIAAGRRAYAVLGQMAELGGRSREFHEQAGALAAQAGVAGLIAVGEEAAPILTGAKAAAGPDTELIAVPDADGALAVLTQRLRPGDVVLVKASRVAGLQRVALALTELGGTAP